MSDLNYCPHLNCTLSLSNNHLLAITDEDEFTINVLPVTPNEAYEFLLLLDGKTSIPDIIKKNKTHLTCEDATLLIECLSESGLLTRNIPTEFITGKQAILEIEDLQNRLMDKSLYNNIFWQKCNEPDDVPENVFIGMAIENYHLLARGSSFDAHALYFHGCRKTRQAMNAVFCSEHGHAEIILSALALLGIDENNIIASVPLPETLGLANSLAYWSASDPLFFFSTMEVLEGKDCAVDSYVIAMEKSGKMDAQFIEKIKSHSLINIEHNHASFGRQLLSTIPVVSRENLIRMKRQTHLFVELYDAYYRAIWEHYSDATSLVRSI
ncbi:hypothetical protein [Sodalis sp. C49]|uniref:hypothetical protein n=1 Tax=unclassified Sodalis (in: enterobacteria) TaxID=2636512 RepID=UPI003965946D